MQRYSVFDLLAFIPLLSNAYFQDSNIRSTSSLVSSQITISSANSIVHGGSLLTYKLTNVPPYLQTLTKVPRVKEFKYLGSTVQESGGCEREVKKRVQAGWNGWRRVSGVICDRRLPARVKGKVYSSVVRPAMVYGLETVAVTKKQVEEMEVAEMKMLRFTMGVTRKDKIRNEHIRSTVKVERLGMKMREGRLRWYGHVMRRDQEYVGRKMMEMELPGKRRRGRSKRIFLDVVKEDMKEVGAKEMDIEDRKM